MLSLVVFGLAFVASAAPPGPDTLTVFSRGLQGGFMKAIPFTIGVGIAKVALLSLALLGVAEVAQRFETAFLVVKFVGAGYLCALGLRKIATAGKTSQREDVARGSRTAWRDLIVGFGLGVSNPNAVIFYVALLPTVVDIGGVTARTYLALITILVVLWLVIAALYAGLASRLQTVMKSVAARRRVQRTSGAVMLGAGVLVATR